MESVFFNMNLGVLMGTICSDFREYPDRRRDLCLEFDLELKQYAPYQSEFRITCVAFGTQAELIRATTKKDETIVVFGYIGDVDIGNGTSAYGNHKFRVTSVHFKYGTMMNFSGKILTQPELKGNRVEFFVGTYRRHETVPVMPCKMKVICHGKQADLMEAFKNIKNVGDSIFVMGSLMEERGSFCIYAKRIEPLLPEQVKNDAYREAGLKWSRKKRHKHGKPKGGNIKDSDHGNRGGSDGRPVSKHDGKGVEQAREATPGVAVQSAGPVATGDKAPGERQPKADA